MADYITISILMKERVCKIFVFFSFVLLCHVCGTKLASNSYADTLPVIIEKDCFFSSCNIPECSAGNISNIITVPAQSLERNNSHNNLLRLMGYSRILQSGALCINRSLAANSKFKLYNLSSPFYCTPANRYYVFALRHLII